MKEGPKLPLLFVETGNLQQVGLPTAELATAPGQEHSSCIKGGWAMERSQFIIDRALYSDDVAARAAHRYTGQLGIEVRCQGANLIVGIWSPDGCTVPEDIWARFSRDLLDERLRAAVRAETSGLQQELLRAALNQAQPAVPHVEV
ncbi:hypothetical protein SH041_14040 [Stenotrophomonas geniculata]|uniref:hypothetical protein n=1 Tax=Stenotrophomonas TaxID=40323 RepID=UPI001EEAA9DB|nr:hypothetical protein [Stenotrophomonas sp. SXG-1]